MIRAAFAILRSPSGSVLLLRRAQGEDFPGTWALPGGKIDEGETAETAVVRTVLERTKYLTGHSGRWLCRSIRHGADAVTFDIAVEAEFVPTLSAKHDAWLWTQPDEALAMDAAV
jgi:8-oxo-dGTP pyrophosphatase MutT (NUDIX family)